MTRSNLLLLVVACPSAAVINALWFGSELQRFARDVTSFSSTADIERFKSVVARQMYAALLQIGLLVAPLILFLLGIVRGELGPGDVPYLIVPSAVVLLVGAAYKRTESRVRQIPAVDDELRLQRDTIINTWVKKPLPDW